jgi:hypothetical protein
MVHPPAYATTATKMLAQIGLILVHFTDCAGMKRLIDKCKMVKAARPDQAMISGMS